ncbi:hypothetical protein Glove_235g27 [Diversispora epigaea]|uniref:Uncharacterized protein n=1 Tax=Diversispora epigaea TaxID=1348612 RepID=A0A397IFJ6_9GLOM|nr:hypothetical protein Glove_235g27 [Diversispora epigaea]
MPVFNMKEYISINHLIDWKTMHRMTTTLSQWIIIATDWEYTQETLMYTSITNPETSEEDQKLRTFKVKLFINELSTKQIMHNRRVKNDEKNIEEKEEEDKKVEEEDKKKNEEDKKEDEEDKKKGRDV